MSENIEYEVTYPLGFLVSVPKDATREDIIAAYMECVQDWVQDGAMPDDEWTDIERLTPGETDEDDPVLAHHLQYNHFPPYDLRLLPYCRLAIEKAKKGEWNDDITIEGDAGTMTVTVNKMVDDFHLHAFVVGWD